MIIDVTDNDHIAANDRVAQYGDGCFTTLCIAAGRIELLDSHMQRLQQDCRRLHIKFQAWQQLQTHLLMRAQRLHDGVLKALISRGIGGRGYSTENVSAACCYVSAAQMPTHYVEQRKHGIKVSISDVKLAAQPLLAGIKHCNRLEQVLVRMGLDQSSCDDAIVCDYNGHVVETSIGNLFWRKNSTWLTPLLDECGVSGVMRNQILKLMKANNIKVLEGKFTIEEVSCCDEMFVCNSLMKIVPVKAIDLPNQRLWLNSQNTPRLNWLTENLNEVIQA